MNILMMHKGDDGTGGALVQMRRLQTGFKSRGVGARIVCRAGSLADSVVIPYWPRLERWLGRITGRTGLNDIHLISSFMVRRCTEFIEADLVDIHCLHSGTFSYLALPGITAQKPVVFTFHDMWPITGHCHASLECMRWKTGCGRCPHLDIYPSVRRDATAIEWRLKRWAYGHSRFTIVTPSAWLRERVKDSMLGEFPVVHIPHGVDTEVFRPLDRESCRLALGVPPGKNVLLCAAECMMRPLKGADLLVRALNALPWELRRDTVLLLFGHSGGDVARQVGMQAIELGYLQSDRLKALAYSAADLFVHPSKAESFGLVVLESIACGTPVVCFRVGGLPELVRPEITGMLAAPDDPQGMANQIIALLEDRARLRVISRRCRSVALEEYSLGLQVERYIEVYRQTIASGVGV